MNRTYIIAEAGVNHNGDFELAKQMVWEAKQAGVDAVKFQTFKSKSLVSSFAPKAEYQKKETDKKESQLEMLERLELSFSHFAMLKDYADELNIDFLSTPFDNESIDFLATLQMSYWKIPSGEITNKPYLMKIAQTKLPIIMSTGMSTIDEIIEALYIFKEYKKADITLLHCNTEYPTPYEDVNLNAMQAMRERFGISIGYSDHTQGIEVAIAAVSLGACMIEKHFTLNKNMQGPDHRASLEPTELKAMTNAIRNIEKALGDGEKKLTKSEEKNRAIARKSIVAKENIKAGEIFTEANLCIKRPGNGISPMKWFDILGKTAQRDYVEDEMIQNE